MNPHSKAGGTNSESIFGKVLSVIFGLGVLAFFAYIAYLICVWLLFGAGAGLLLFGMLAGVAYFLFGWLPSWLSVRTGQTKWQAGKSVDIILLLVVGVVLGAYLLPKLVNVNLAWYWRVLLGVGMGVIGLKTRRYP